MSALRFAPLFLLLAPLACGTEPSTTEGASTGGASSSGTTEGVSVGTTSDVTGGLVTTTTPTTSGGESTVGEGESTAAATTTTTTDGTTSGTSTTGEDFCAGDSPHVKFVTSMGEMTVKLDAVKAPNTVANFIEYVEAGFYDNTIFHRVIPGFVMQGGGYTPDLMEKPTNAPIALEISDLIHIDGAIAMARTNEPDSATSQFYITDGAQPALDTQYAVFGSLVAGFEVRDAIADVPVQEEAGFMDVPVEDVIVEMAFCVAGSQE